MPTIGQAVGSDVEVVIGVGGQGDYGPEGLLDEWLKGAGSSLGPLHEELIRGWNALDAGRHEELRSRVCDELYSRGFSPLMG